MNAGFNQKIQSEARFYPIFNALANLNSQAGQNQNPVSMTSVGWILFPLQVTNPFSRTLLARPSKEFHHAIRVICDDPIYPPIQQALHVPLIVHRPHVHLHLVVVGIAHEPLGYYAPAAFNFRRLKGFCPRPVEPG
jgi:hypothetical protein